MTIKHGEFKTGYETTTNFVEETYDIYEKTEGNYTEYLLNKSRYSSGFFDESGNRVVVDDVEETNYEVLPGATLEDITGRFSSNQYLTWTTTLTQIS